MTIAASSMSWTKFYCQFITNKPKWNGAYSTNWINSILYNIRKQHKCFKKLKQLKNDIVSFNLLHQIKYLSSHFGKFFWFHSSTQHVRAQANVLRIFKVAESTSNSVLVFDTGIVKLGINRFFYGCGKKLKSTIVLLCVT